MPQQRAVELDALADQPFAVIDQQPQVELGPVQVRGRERLQALLQRGAGDVERVDRIGLAALAGALASAWRSGASGSAAPARRARSETAPATPDTCRQSSSAQTRSPSRPRAHRNSASNPRRPTGTVCSPSSSPVAGRDRGDRVRTLVSVRAKHDHGPRPPLDPSGADVWRTRLAGGGATHLSSHARHPRPATSDKTKGSQALARPTASKRVSSPPGRDHLLRVGRHRRPESKQQASKQQRAGLDREMPCAQFVVAPGAHHPAANQVADLVGELVARSAPRGVAVRADRIRSRRVATLDRDPVEVTGRNGRPEAIEIQQAPPSFGRTVSDRAELTRAPGVGRPRPRCDA